MGNELWFRSHKAVFVALILAFCLSGCGGKPAGQNNVTWEFEGDDVRVTAEVEGVRFLLIAGRRLNEPVARGGPFVMNTKQEVLQAFSDYQNNRFGG